MSYSKFKVISVSELKDYYAQNNVRVITSDNTYTYYRVEDKLGLQASFKVAVPLYDVKRQTVDKGWYEK